MPKTYFDAPSLPLRSFRSWGAPGRQRMTLEGGKNDTPAPDPRLADAQIRSMRHQEGIIDRMIANSEALLPLQREQMQFGLDASRQAFNQAQDDREFAIGRRGQLVGMQNQLIDDARSFNTQDRQNQLAGEAIGDVNQAFGAAREQQTRGLSRMGVNPNDGRFAATASQMSLQQALAQSTAANKVRQAARLEGYGLTDRATNALSGYPTMGMQATGAGAGYGAAGLGIANQGLAGMNSGFGQAAGVAGQMGQNAGSVYGAQLNAHSQANAQNASEASSIIGTGVGVAAMFL